MKYKVTRYETISKVLEGTNESDAIANMTQIYSDIDQDLEDYKQPNTEVSVEYKASPVLPDGWVVSGPQEFTRDVGMFMLIVDATAATVTDAIWTGRIVIFNERGEKLTVAELGAAYTDKFRAIQYLDERFSKMLHDSNLVEG